MKSTLPFSIGGRACLSVTLALTMASALYSPVSAKKSEKNQDGRAGNWKNSAQGAPALEECRKKAVEHPEDAEAQNDYGWALRQNGDLKAAETSLRASIKLNPNLGYSH